MTSGSTPVAIGSSVPRCPILLVLAMRRILPTTSCEVQPSGLSTTITPSNVVRSLTFLLGSADVPKCKILVPVQPVQPRQNQRGRRQQEGRGNKQQPARSSHEELEAVQQAPGQQSEVSARRLHLQYLET